jgi:hypothetical protein
MSSNQGSLSSSFEVSSSSYDTRQNLNSNIILYPQDNQLLYGHGYIARLVRKGSIISQHTCAQEIDKILGEIWGTDKKVIKDLPHAIIDHPDDSNRNWRNKKDRLWQTSDEAAGNTTIDIRTLTNINRVGKRGIPAFYALNGVELPKRLKVNESTVIRNSAPFNEGSFCVFPSLNSMVVVGTWDERLFDQCSQREYVRIDGVMLPTGTNSLPEFAEADEEIMVLWRKMVAIYAAKANRQNIANQSSSLSSDNSSVISTIMNISATDLKRKSSVEEMYAFWEGIKHMNLDGVEYCKVTDSMSKEMKTAFKSRFEERSKEYLMCRSGFYVRTVEDPFPSIKKNWTNFKSTYTSKFGVREIAVKYALMTSGQTEMQISELSHPYVCISS